MNNVCQYLVLVGMVSIYNVVKLAIIIMYVVYNIGPKCIIAIST
jgi:hypothetical protein